MLFLVDIRPNPGISMSQVEEALTPAHDWYKYEPTSWIICTPDNSKTWSERLTPLASPNGALFICRLNKTDVHGLMTADFWQWLDRHNND
jgi:hypothetical protein